MLASTAMTPSSAFEGQSSEHSDSDVSREGPGPQKSQDLPSAKTLEKVHCIMQQNVYTNNDYQQRKRANDSWGET